MNKKSRFKQLTKKLGILFLVLIVAATLLISIANRKGKPTTGKTYKTLRLAPLNTQSDAVKTNIKDAQTTVLNLDN